MYKNKFFGLFLFALFLIFSSCDGGSGDSGDILLEGIVSNPSQFGDLTVVVLEGNSRKGSTTVNSLGNFGIRFISSTGVVTLRFESDTFNAERPNIQVIDQSVTNLNITLQLNPTLIIIDRWQVFQDPISFSGTQTIDYNESQAEFNLDGDGGNCMFASGSSLITYRVKSISITDCREGVKAQSTGSIVLEADEAILISSNRDAIVALDDAFIGIGQTSSPINNTIVIQSFNQFGINAAGNSIVDVDPQNQCSISGSRGATNVNSNASVNTSTCTLSDG
ncbi:MAG: hypothetical protein E4H21_00875 [Thermodesulfobacteriales bacterium]|nr:MAG: hypothetical protein E4H21_00875 [Thermodesulfobacteriales bacterium]